MAAAAEAGFLLIRSAQRVLALRLSDVRETMRPVSLDTVHGAPAYLLGIALIRGMPTPVIDVALLLGARQDPQERAPQARLVTLRLGARAAALRVDAVIAVRSMSCEQVMEAPPLLRDACREHVAGMGILDQQLFSVLNASRLIPQSLWSLLEPHGTGA